MFYAALAPAIIDLRQRTSKKACVELAQKKPGCRRSTYSGSSSQPRGLGRCGVEIPARDRRITGVAVEILKGAKPREIRIFPAKSHYLNITKSRVPARHLNCLSSLTR
jgi:hypothetical protein